MPSPLVSVLIPAHNAERWIGHTIESALRQTWPATEIVVVDDGSSDGTLGVARVFASSRVKVVTQPQQGASAARNRALAEAQGDYVQWLDADDLLARTKIAEQMAAARRSGDPLTLLSSPFGTFYWRTDKARITPNALWCDLAPIDYLLKSFSENLWMSPAAWLVSRTLTAAAGPWNERLTLNDDGEYFCRAVAASTRVMFVPGARSFYRQSGPGQLSRTVNRRALESFALSLCLSIDRLLACEDSDRTRHAAWLFCRHCAPWFAPDHLDLLRPLVPKVGAEIVLPPAGFKARAAQSLLGRTRGAQVLASARQMKFLAAIEWDRLLYRLNPRSAL